MDSLTHIELIDRNNNVIAVEAIPASAFPITMRLVHPEESVASVETQGKTGWRHWVLTPVGTLAVVLGTALLFGAQMYVQHAGDPGVLFYATGTFFIFGLLIWPSFWAVVGRRSRRPHLLRAHQLWTCAMILVSIGVWYLTSWVNFLWPETALSAAFWMLLSFVFGLVLLYGHLTISSRASSPRRWYIAGTIVTVFGLLIVLAGTVDYKTFDTELDYDATIKPLDARLIPAQTLESFSADLGQLEGDLKKQLQQQPQTP